MTGERDTADRLK